MLDALPQAGYSITVTESTTGEGTESNMVEEGASADEVLLIIITQ